MPARQLPARSARLVRFFARYAAWHVRRHFHTVRVSRDTRPDPAIGSSLVIFANHASWWDPLICLLLARRFYRERTSFAPIDSAALERYRFFSRLGFFGVEQRTRRGAATFLRTAGTILARRDTALWLTPQGRFADARERPPRFAGGLGHLAAREPSRAFVPLAIEYAFWEESRPEVLVRFGPPAGLAPGLTPAGATAVLEAALGATQDALALDVRARRTERFEVLLRGGAGVGGVYDLWRRLRSRLGGSTFNPEHGTR